MSFLAYLTKLVIEHQAERAAHTPQSIGVGPTPQSRQTFVAIGFPKTVDCPVVFLHSFKALHH